MRKMCVIPKHVIEDWLQDNPGLLGAWTDQRLELACHIASIHELQGYPVGGLVARLLPNGDIRVKTPMYIIESPAGLWGFIGFLLVVIAIGLVFIISYRWEAWTC